MTDTNGSDTELNSDMTVHWNYSTVTFAKVAVLQVTVTPHSFHALSKYNMNTFLTHYIINYISYGVILSQLYIYSIYGIISVSKILPQY